MAKRFNNYSAGKQGPSHAYKTDNTIQEDLKKKKKFSGYTSTVV